MAAHLLDAGRCHFDWVSLAATGAHLLCQRPAKMKAASGRHWLSSESETAPTLTKETVTCKINGHVLTALLSDLLVAPLLRSALTVYLSFFALFYNTTYFYEAKTGLVSFLPPHDLNTLLIIQNRVYNGGLHPLVHRAKPRIGPVAPNIARNIL